MNWLDFACRVPYPVALTIGLLVSVSRCGKYKAPAILAACGFGIALVQTLMLSYLYQNVGSLFSDAKLGVRLISLVSSGVSAVFVTLLLTAVFTARESIVSTIAVSENDVNFAMTQIGEGATLDQLSAKLTERGLAPQMVGSVIQNVEIKQSHRAGWRNLIIGGLMCGAGIAFSLISFLLAANAPGGGRYVVTYGLVIAGGAKALQGLVQIGK